jgi:hypothetical protein
MALVGWGKVLSNQHTQNTHKRAMEIEKLKQDREYKKLIENDNGNGNHQPLFWKSVLHTIHSLCF